MGSLKILAKAQISIPLASSMLYAVPVSLLQGGAAVRVYTAATLRGTNFTMLM